MLAALLLFAAWAIERLAPFEGWWQALRLVPAVVYGGLAYAFLADGSGGDRELTIPDARSAQRWYLTSNGPAPPRLRASNAPAR